MRYRVKGKLLILMFLALGPEGSKMSMQSFHNIVKMRFRLIYVPHKSFFGKIAE